MLDLREVLGVTDLPDTEKIVELLRTKFWNKGLSIIGDNEKANCDFTMLTNDECVIIFVS